MKNAIVYSLHVDDSIYGNINILQFKYSVDTIINFNSTIPIKVYLSPSSLKDCGYPLPQYKNIEYVYFDAEPDLRLDNKTLATWTSHKWKVSFEALKNFNLDNVLYVDMDTIFKKNPAYLFDIYGDTKYIYSKITEFGKEYVDLFGISNGMNDGTNLISKQILKHSDNILEERIRYVHRFQEELKSKPKDLDFDKKMSWVQWSACQFGVSEYMKNIGLPIKEFKLNDVALISELHLLDNPEDIGVLHYFNYNTVDMLPKKYWGTINFESMRVDKTNWSN
jgi:hypothetical protein